MIELDAVEAGVSIADVTARLEPTAMEVGIV